MRPLVLSNCEKELILRSIAENRRVDGRKCTDYRKIAVTLGDDVGSCLVVQGNTKVFAQISCSITTPNSGRPSEGSLRVNLELSPMAASHFESGRMGELGVEVCRLLERSLKQSRCLDLESLCVVSGEKVWEIRVDVHVLDFDGTIVDAASVAAICALRHFRRPEVTLNGDGVEVHSSHDKEPVPLNLLHYPLCITFGFCDETNVLLVDSSEMEEQVLNGKIVIAMNSHGEMCAAHCSGNLLFRKEQILRCASKAALRAKELTEIINRVFEQDAKSRSQHEKRGFSTLLEIGPESAMGKTGSVSQTLSVHTEKITAMEVDKTTVERSAKIIRKGKVARVATSSARLPTQQDDSDVEIIAEAASEIRLDSGAVDTASEQTAAVEGKRKRKTRGKQPNKEVQSLLDEIEDDVQVLLPTESGYKTGSRSEKSEENVEVIDLAGALRPSKTGKEKHKKGE